MNTTLTSQEAWSIIGGLSRPSKMPGFGYGLPAGACRTGSVLAQIQGTPCASCYAFKGNYAFSTVKAAQYRRLRSIHHPQWAEAFITLLRKKRCKYFRWHDSGDIQSLTHLLNIFAIAYALPEMHFWLPTQERGIISIAMKLGIPIPANLVIRVSAPKINIESELSAFGLPTSPVRSDHAVTNSYRCPAPQQGNACDSCRACWSPSVKWVEYTAH